MNQSKPIKVLHILKNIQRGGVEQFILNQYKVLAAENVIFDFCLYGPDSNLNDQFMMNEFTKLGSRFLYHSYPNTHFLRFIKELRENLRYGQYDVVHCHQNFFSGAILPIAQIEKVPVRIAHAHTTEERKKTGLKRKIYTQIMRKSILNTSTHLLGASPLANQYVYGKQKDAEYLANGIDLESFTQVSHNDIRSELGLSDSAVLFGHVGSFKPIKNHKFLINIFSDFIKEYQNAYLLLVGEGREQERIKQMVTELNLNDKVLFLDNRQDIPLILKNLNVFLFPSLFEGLGISLIEAQAAGVSSIISPSIPSEADLGLGLVNRVPLEKENCWIITMNRLVKEPPHVPEIKERIIALKSKGFDHFSSAMRLLEIYRSPYNKE